MKRFLKKDVYKDVTDELIGRTLSDLTNPEHERLVKTLDVLSKYSNKSISKDTYLLVASNLLGMILILNHEKLNVITSKAFGFLGKGRM